MSFTSCRALPCISAQALGRAVGTCVRLRSAFFECIRARRTPRNRGSGDKPYCKGRTLCVFHFFSCTHFLFLHGFRSFPDFFGFFARKNVRNPPFPHSKGKTDRRRIKQPADAAERRKLWTPDEKLTGDNSSVRFWHYVQVLFFYCCPGAPSRNRGDGLPRRQHGLHGTPIF